MAVYAEDVVGWLLRISGADRDRTGDPLVANQVLSQLSYRPESETSTQVSRFACPSQEARSLSQGNAL